MITNRSRMNSSTKNRPLCACDQCNAERTGNLAGPLLKPPQAANDHAVAVVKSRVTAPLKVALTIISAAPTAMKPTSTRTHELSKISDRMPKTAANPTIISSPDIPAEP